MADGDIVHGQPYGFYKKAYEAINDSGYTLMGGLLKDIKHIGNVPVILAKRIGEYLSKTIKNGDVNWSNLSSRHELSSPEPMKMK